MITQPIVRARGLMLVGAVLLARAGEAQAQDSGSLTLRAAIEMSLAYHPSIGAAHATERAAAAVLGQAKSGWWPTLNLNGSLFQHQKQMLVFPLHALDTSAFRFDHTLIQGNVSAGWTLWDGGARSARIKGARADEAVAVAGSQAAEMTLIAEVTGAYLEVLSAQRMLDAQLESLRALQAERDRVVRLLAEGRAARVELLRVDAAMAQAESERIRSAAMLETAERSLARWLGSDTLQTTAGRLVTVTLKDTVAGEDRDVLVAQFEAANPDLAEARQRAEAAAWARRAATAAWHPRLDVVGAYLLFSSPEFDTQGEWQAGIRLSYPLFTGGARSGAVSTASARQDVADEYLRLTQLMGEETIDRALTAVRESQARAAAVATAARHLEEVARIEQLALDAGAGIQTDFLRADAELRRTRALLIEARHREILARVQLARTTGALSLAWLTQTLEAVQ